MPAIRPLYDAHGVDGYYRDHAGAYQNPHFSEIRLLLERHIPRLDTAGGVLDFAAGGGEATQVLQGLGIRLITGCDPYTHALYRERTGLPCLELSFKDVIRRGLPGTYSLVICSFALHLCPGKDLFSLCQSLLQAAPLLLVLTPHKRPELETPGAFELLWEDFALTAKGKKVRCKAYGLQESLRML
ncbi:MAG: class I SAM-dependent methyltransferase [Saprospirales bacterium]|jgi:hypothetical protein|nr:class I SAM-dependent methyltransferase [Saprospirales bacterium]MBK8921117.1 class I SAM-dependent methyltransferase [Saprospirales bacterium]